MNRRSLIRCAPAAGMAALLAGAVPVIAQAQAETPIMQDFRQWAELARKLDNDEAAEDEVDVICEQMGVCERRMRAAPAQNAADVLAKIMAATNFGAFALKDEMDDPALWGEARAMVAA